MSTSYSNISFWKRYCDADLAEIVAKCFPEYWLEQNAWYTNYHHSLQFTERLAIQLAVGWYLSHRDQLKTLPNTTSDDYPYFKRVISPGPDFYREDLLEAVQTYLQYARPQRPDYPLADNPFPLSDGTYYVRGSRLADQRNLEFLINNKHCESLANGQSPQYLRWGPLMLDRQEAETAHFCVAGVTRAGKTILLRLLHQSLSASDNRFIIYDFKTELYPSLVPASDPGLFYSILNPFDQRCVAWDIAADAAAQHRALEIAAVLFPNSDRSSEFFVESPRTLIATAIEILNQHRGSDWTFLDLMLSLSLANIQDTFNRSELGRHVLKHYLQSGKGSAADILKTIDAKIKPFLPAAAAWSKAKKRIGLVDWVRNQMGGGLVLAYNSAHHHAISRVNQAMLAVLFNTLADSSITKPQRTFVLLDELESLGKLAGLPHLLRVGAGAGTTVALAFHDIDTLKHEYKQETEGMLAMCSHFAILNVKSHSTAQWASRCLRQQDVYYPRLSQTTHPNSNTKTKTSDDQKTSYSTSQEFVTRPVVSTTAIQEQPLASPKTGLHAYFSSHMHPTYKGVLFARNLFRFPVGQERPIDPYYLNYCEDWVAYQGDKIYDDYNDYRLWNPTDVKGYIPRDEADLYVDPLAKPFAFDDEDSLSSEMPLSPDRLNELRDRLNVPKTTPGDSQTDDESASDWDEDNDGEPEPDLFDMKRIDFPPLDEDE